MPALSYLRKIGVYGFEEVEPIILAALVTEDPLLLIGKSGTGKTFLLNSLSEAMGLEHRHYNASLISFDDLVGFPYPTPDYSGVKYLETPATVWGAESVLVDEISRCKPEHQNRLFSLIQERRIQGLLLEKLRYRWAAMNPCDLNQGVDDVYAGSEPLDQALADRFAFVVQVPDWNELDVRDQKAIADPRGDGLFSVDHGEIRDCVTRWRASFVRLVQRAPLRATEYARLAATLLGETGCRLSPRRVRQLARNLLAVSVVSEDTDVEKQYLMALRWSVPQRAWGQSPKEETLLAAHRSAWLMANQDSTKRWLNEFRLEPDLSRKLEELITRCPDKDTGTLAVTRLIAQEPRERAAVFALAAYPAVLKDKLPIGKEGVNEIGKLAARLLYIDGEIKWCELGSSPKTQHPEFGRLSQILAGLPDCRRERATQLFYYLLVNNITVKAPENLEKELEKCVAVLRSHNL